MSLSIPLGQLHASHKAFEYGSPRQSSVPVPNPTSSFWIDTPNANPLATEGSEGIFIDDADICIIGSGITGVSAAYHLATAVERGDVVRPGDNPFRVLILEARNFCYAGSGATGRNGGHLTPAVFLDFCGYQAKYGTEQALRSFALENHTASKIVKIIRQEEWADAVDLVEGGHTTTFFTQVEYAGAQADFDAAKSAGMDLTEVRWLTEGEMKAKYGASYPGVEIGGFNLWPLKFVTRLYQLAKEKSGIFELNIHTRTPATKISPSTSSSRRWAVQTPRGVLNCSYVIHATNAYASYLLPHMSGPAGIVPTRGQVMATRANVFPQDLFKCSWDGNEGFEYWFPRPVSVEEKPLRPDFEYYQSDDSEVNELVGVALRNFLPGVFPGKFAEGEQPEAEWTGIMGYTRSKDPFVGPVIDDAQPDGVKFKGQYVSGGYSGHGMPRAFSCAAVVASMIVSDISETAWTTPDWFPEVFLTTARR
ncbi:FAD dependent oxidoreductase [Mycena galericulata]|nr:FAD dependent oxidoreductase [Mycena galericulata]